MKIYRVDSDVRIYQGFLPVDQQAWRLQNEFCGCPMWETWKSLDVYVLHTEKKKGNFFSLSLIQLAFDKHAVQVLEEQIKQCSELLPLNDQNGEQFFALNVLECIDMLDQEKTEWEYDDATGIKVWIKKYAFLPERWTGVPLFKIPEQKRTSIFTVTGTKEPEREFKHLVEGHGLTGLLFDEVWSDE